MPGGVELATAYVTLKADGRRLPGEAAALGVQGGKAYGKGFERSSISTDRAMERIGRTSKRVFLAGAVGIGFAEKKAADYNAEMATVFTLAHANTKQQEQLAKAAKTVGTNIGFSATKTGQAEEELIKAGVSLRDIMGGGLKGALDLAAAGQTDVASATEVAASAMTQFKLSGRDVPHIADLLAAGADKALGSVTDLGYGLSQAGTTAHQMNLSIEDTVGTLAEFAQNGLIGERSGTTLKMMLLRLANPTEKSSKLMDKYGLSIYKANGQLKTMPQIAGQLQKSFKDLEPAQRNAALGTIFGSRAIQGANILIKDGAAGNRKWIKSVNDQGFAAQQAAGKMDSLKGDAAKLNAELENAFINASGKQSFLRMLAQDATGLLKSYNKLSDAQRELINKTAVKAVAGAGIVWAATKVYSLAKSTSEIYGALFKTKAASSALGAVSGKGVTPVYVTNWGGAAGAARGGAGAAEGAVAGAAARRAGAARLVVSKLAITAGSVLLAGQVAQGISSLLKGVLPRNPSEKGVFSGFSKPSPRGSLADDPITKTLGNLLKGRDSLKSTFNTVSQSKGGGGINGFGLRSNINLGKLASLGTWNAISDDEDRVKKLDTALAALDKRSPGEALRAYSKILDETGLSAKKVNEILPKTALAMDPTPSNPKWFTGMTDGLANAAKQAVTTTKVLQTVPKDIRTFVSTPGLITSLGHVRDLQREYHLTPKQVRTIMTLQGFSQTQKRIVLAGKAFTSLPKQVKTALRADTVKSQADVKKLQRQYHLTPKQVQTVMHVSGVDAQIAKVHALQVAIAQIRSKSVTIDAVIRRRGAAAGTTVPGAFASGGYTGAGRKYEPAGIVHRDEFVFSKEATQGNVAMLSTLHSQLRGYARGGLVGRAAQGGDLGGGGDVHVHVYDTDGTLLGTMSGVADERYYANGALAGQTR